MQKILGVPDDHLKDVLAFHKDCTNEVKLAFRDLSVYTRSHYASFIKKAGRNIYPLLIASEYDYDNELGGGVGCTFSLYLKDGQEFRITPNANSGYAIYKSASHILFGLGAIIGPYMDNPEARGWKKPLIEYKESIMRGLDSLDPTLNGFAYEFDKKPVEQLLRNTITFIGHCLQNGTFSFEGWKQFPKHWCI